MFELITGVVGGVSAIAVAIVTYVKPKHAVKINAAIPVVATAIVEVASIFLK
jgi:hypothetical protein